MARTKAACGLTPGHGWGSDLFIDRKCARCVAALAKEGVEAKPVRYRPMVVQKKNETDRDSRKI